MTDAQRWEAAHKRVVAALRELGRAEVAEEAAYRQMAGQCQAPLTDWQRRYNAAADAAEEAEQAWNAALDAQKRGEATQEQVDATHAAKWAAIHTFEEVAM